MYAGVDWSGTPHPKEARVELDLYIPCGVWVPDFEAVDRYFADWRKELGRPVTYEFHGHRCTPDMLQRAAEYALDYAQVYAFVLDKQVVVEELGSEVFNRPVLLPMATGHLVLEQMLAVGPLKRVWLDEDIASNRRLEFNTRIMRQSRSLWPDSPEVKHYPSHKANLIQLADMVAFVLQRDARGLAATSELPWCATQLWRKDRNRIRWGRGSDLRPYL